MTFWRERQKLARTPGGGLTAWALVMKSGHGMRLCKSRPSPLFEERKGALGLAQAHIRRCSPWPFAVVLLAESAPKSAPAGALSAGSECPKSAVRSAAGGTNSL